MKLKDFVNVHKNKKNKQVKFDIKKRKLKEMKIDVKNLLDLEIKPKHKIKFTK